MRFCRKSKNCSMKGEERRRKHTVPHRGLAVWQPGAFLQSSRVQGPAGGTLQDERAGRAERSPGLGNTGQI